MIITHFKWAGNCRGRYVSAPGCIRKSSRYTAVPGWRHRPLALENNKSCRRGRCNIHIESEQLSLSLFRRAWLPIFTIRAIFDGKGRPWRDMQNIAASLAVKPIRYHIIKTSSFSAVHDIWAASHCLFMYYIERFYEMTLIWLLSAVIASKANIYLLQLGHIPFGALCRYA